MKEYRIKWQQRPHVQHDVNVLFVEANNPEDAKEIARDHIERRFGIEWLSIHEVKEAAPMPAGRVKENYL